MMPSLGHSPSPAPASPHWSHPPRLRSLFLGSPRSPAVSGSYPDRLPLVGHHERLVGRRAVLCPGLSTIRNPIYRTGQACRVLSSALFGFNRLTTKTAVRPASFSCTCGCRGSSGILSGSCLASVGVALQALLRNPLADPYVLGVSSGAALGVALAVLFGIGTTVLALSVLPAVRVCWRPAGPACHLPDGGDL